MMTEQEIKERNKKIVKRIKKIKILDNIYLSIFYVAVICFLVAAFVKQPEIQVNLQKILLVFFAIFTIIAGFCLMKDSLTNHCIILERIYKSEFECELELIKKYNLSKGEFREVDFSDYEKAEILFRKFFRKGPARYYATILFSTKDDPTLDKVKVVAKDSNNGEILDTIIIKSFFEFKELFHFLD